MCEKPFLRSPGVYAWDHDDDLIQFASFRRLFKSFSPVIDRKKKPPEGGYSGSIKREPRRKRLGYIKTGLHETD
jgi:hypothetical protein